MSGYAFTWKDDHGSKKQHFEGEILIILLMSFADIISEFEKSQQTCHQLITRSL